MDDINHYIKMKITINLCPHTPENDEFDEFFGLTIWFIQFQFIIVFKYCVSVLKNDTIDRLDVVLKPRIGGI